MFLKRKLGKDVFLYIENDTGLWFLSKKNNEKEIFGKKLIKELRKRIDENSKRVSLELIEIHPTQSCNLKCKYCYIPDVNKNRSSYLSFEDLDFIFLKIINYYDKIKKNLPRIIFHGGEPLIRFDDIKKIIMKYSDKFKFLIQTNGFLLDEDKISFLEEYNVSTGISIDADPNSRCSDQDFIFKLLKKFKDPTKIGIVSTITRDNIYGLKNFIEKLYNLRIGSLVLNPVSPEQPNSLDFVPEITLLSKAYKEIIENLILLNSAGDHKLVIDNIEGWILPFISTYSPIYCRMAPCGAGRYNIVISPEGDVYPCSGFSGFKEFKMGNVFSENIEDIINKPLSLRERNVNEIRKCRKCIYKIVCGANCPIPLYFLNKNLYYPSYYCKFYKGLVDFLFLKIYQSNTKVLKYLISESYLNAIEKSKKLFAVEN